MAAVRRRQLSRRSRKTGSVARLDWRIADFHIEVIEDGVELNEDGDVDGGQGDGLALDEGPVAAHAVVGIDVAVDVEAAIHGGGAVWAGAVDDVDVPEGDVAGFRMDGDEVIAGIAD